MWVLVQLHTESATILRRKDPQGTDKLVFYDGEICKLSTLSVDCESLELTHMGKSLKIAITCYMWNHLRCVHFDQMLAQWLYGIFHNPKADHNSTQCPNYLGQTVVPASGIVVLYAYGWNIIEIIHAFTANHEHTLFAFGALTLMSQDLAYDSTYPASGQSFMTPSQVPYQQSEPRDICQGTTLGILKP